MLEFRAIPFSIGKKSTYWCGRQRDCLLESPFIDVTSICFLILDMHGSQKRPQHSGVWNRNPWVYGTETSHSTFFVCGGTKARTEKQLLPSYSSFILYSHHFWTYSSQNGPTETLHQAFAFFLIHATPHKKFTVLSNEKNTQPLQLKAATKDRGAPRVWRPGKHLINLSYSTIEKLELGKSPHKYGFMWCKHRFFLSIIFKDLVILIPHWFHHLVIGAMF